MELTYFASIIKDYRQWHKINLSKHIIDYGVYVNSKKINQNPKHIYVKK